MRKHQSGVKVPDPTPRQIRQAVARIQAGWTRREEVNHRVVRPGRVEVPVVPAPDFADWQSAESF